MSPDRTADTRHGQRRALALGDGLNAHQRRPQVAIDVDRQRLQRRDVKHLHPCRLRRVRLRLGLWKREPINRRQKRRECLPRPGRRQQQRTLPTRKHRPRQPLHARGVSSASVNHVRVVA